MRRRRSPRFFPVSLQGGKISQVLTAAENTARSFS